MALHEKRISTDPVFKVIQSERDRYYKLKNSKTLTLNFEERKKMFDEDEKITLKNTNIRLKAMHKKEVKSVKDLPDDFEYVDRILQETVNITPHYSDLLNKAGAHEVEEKPLLLQYQAEKDN